MTTSKQQNEAQVPPERIWIDAETNVGRTRGEGTFYFTKPDFPSAAYVPEHPATAGVVSNPDAISVVEKMRDEWASVDLGFEANVQTANAIIARLRTLSPSVGVGTEQSNNEF